MFLLKFTFSVTSERSVTVLPSGAASIAFCSVSYPIPSTSATFCGAAKDVTGKRLIAAKTVRAAAHTRFFVIMIPLTF
jgi:hypothetical protein